MEQLLKVTLIINNTKAFNISNYNIADMSFNLEEKQMYAADEAGSIFMISIEQVTLLYLT